MRLGIGHIDMDKEYQSGDVGRAALRMALSETRVEESILREELAKLEIRAVAVNCPPKRHE